MAVDNFVRSGQTRDDSRRFSRIMVYEDDIPSGNFAVVVYEPAYKCGD